MLKFEQYKIKVSKRHFFMSFGFILLVFIFLSFLYMIAKSVNTISIHFAHGAQEFLLIHSNSLFNSLAWLYYYNIFLFFFFFLLALNN